MKRLRLQVRRIGPHFRSVLVSGEAGTGKEWVARALHGMGRPAGGRLLYAMLRRSRTLQLSSKQVWGRWTPLHV